MKRSELIKKIADATGTKPALVDTILKAEVEVYQENLIGGQEVYIVGIGGLSVKDQAGRKSRNIHTGEQQWTDACKRVVYKASKDLKRAVNK